MFLHGKATQVAVGGYEITQFLNQANAAASIDTAETSHFGSQAKTYVLGEDDGTFSVKGLYDGALGGIDEISDILLGYNVAEAVIPIVIADAGFKAGNRAKMGRCKVTAWETDAPVGDVVSISGDFQASGGIRFGQMLGGNVPISATGVTNGTTVDSNTSSSGPLRIFAHVLNGRNGTAQVTVQHSDNGTTWIDFGVLPSVTATTNTGQYLAQAGGTKRYLRIKTTLAGTTGSATVIVSISRS